MKLCASCDQVKPRDHYNPFPRNADGLHSYCKECRRRRNRREKLARRYGLTEKGYATLREKQDGACAICRRACPLGRLSVDHDHATGSVRGLLCRRCNAGLGNFDDSPEQLTRALAYLKGE